MCAFNPCSSHPAKPFIIPVAFMYSQPPPLPSIPIYYYLLDNRLLNR